MDSARLSEITCVGGHRFGVQEEDRAWRDEPAKYDGSAMSCWTSCWRGRTRPRCSPMEAHARGLTWTPPAEAASGGTIADTLVAVQEPSRTLIPRRARPVRGRWARLLSGRAFPAQPSVRSGLEGECRESRTEHGLMLDGGRRRSRTYPWIRTIRSSQGQRIHTGGTAVDRRILARPLLSMSIRCRLGVWDMIDEMNENNGLYDVDGRPRSQEEPRAIRAWPQSVSVKGSCGAAGAERRLAPLPGPGS